MLVQELVLDFFRQLVQELVQEFFRQSDQEWAVVLVLVLVLVYMGSDLNCKNELEWWN